MDSNKKLKIIGEGEWLYYAYSAAIEYNRWNTIELFDIIKINEYSYDLSGFNIPEENVDYFLAIDGSIFGTVREKHLSILVSKGFNFISIMPSHMSSIMKNMNCLIASFVNINNFNFRIQFNTFIGPYCNLPSSFSTGRSVTIGPYTDIQPGVSIGKNVTLIGVKKISSNISIGEYTKVDNIEIINKVIKPLTSHTHLFPRSVNIKN